MCGNLSSLRSPIAPLSFASLALLGLACTTGSCNLLFAENNPLQNAALQLRQPIAHDITSGQTHQYTVSLKSGEFASVNLEQRGIDVVARLLTSENRVNAIFDDEVGNQGTEHVDFVATTSGSYSISIEPRLKNVTAGSYQILLTDIHRATEAERARFESRQLRTQSLRLVDSSKYDEALAVAERALALAEKTPGTNRVYLALLNREISLIYWMQENPSKARPFAEHALSTLREELGPEHPQTAHTESAVASLYMTADELDKSEQLIRHAIATEEKTLGPEHPWVADSLRTLGLLDQLRGNGEKAEQSCIRALAIVEKTLGDQNFQYAELQNNIGILYLDRHDYARAGKHLERALAIEEKLFGTESLNLAVILQNLGIVAREQKDYPLAERYYLRALSIREKTIGLEHPDVAGNLINLANIYRISGNKRKGLETQLRALSILEKTAGPHEKAMIFSLGNVARNYAAIGDLKNAILFQSRVDDAIEQRIAAQIMVGSEEQKSDLLAEIAERTERTVSLNLQLAPHDPSAASLAALVLLQRKGRVLDAMVDSLAAVQARSTARDQALMKDLRRVTEALAQLVLQGPRKQSRAEYDKAVERLQDNKNELEAEVSRTSAEFRAESQPVTLEAVQSSIPDPAALLEFVVYRPFDPDAISNSKAYGKPHYAVYVIHGRGTPEGIDLGEEATIRPAIEKFRQALRDPYSADIQESSRELYARLMQPIASLLRDNAQLLISPDGGLHLIPFEALIDADGHYLLQRHGVTYLTGRDLLRMRVQHSSASAPVVIADPAFGEPGVQIASAVPAKLKLDTRRSITTAPDLSSVYFAPLAGTALEARSIKSIFPGARTFTGTAASKDQLRKLNAPSILHIATHGFFLTESTSNAQKPSASGTRSVSATAKIANPLLRSGLALSGANLTRSSGDNGILTAMEAAHLNLWGTKLVTLSACDTGLGEVKIGEGVYGLRRSFFLAGAETLVMSLWPVSDYTTREMMTAYYSGLKKGLGRGEALRAAELSMLRRKGRSHPFYWASFIQSGEWANLDGKR